MRGSPADFSSASRPCLNSSLEFLFLVLSKRIVDDFVYDFERQPGEEIRDYDTRFNILWRRFEAVTGQVNPLIKAHVFLIKANLSSEKQSQIVSVAMSRYEYEPLRDAMLTSILRAGAFRGGVPLHSKTVRSKLCPMVEAQEEGDEEEPVLEVNDASEDELEPDYQEAVAIMTVAKQRRTEVDKARQFFRKPQSSEERKARIDKLKQRLPCVLDVRKTTMSVRPKSRLSIGRESRSKRARNPINFR